MLLLGRNRHFAACFSVASILAAVYPGALGKVKLPTTNQHAGGGHVIVMSQEQNEDTSSELKLQTRQKRNSGVGYENVPLTSEFNVSYSGSVGLDTPTNSYIFLKPDNDTSQAVRVTVMAEDATNEFPVQFTVREQMNLLSWQVPLILDTSFRGYQYNHVSRTLCPAGNDPKTDPQEIIVDVASMSHVNKPYTLLASLVSLNIGTDEALHTSVTPSEPKYYQYDFPDDVNSVVVKVESDSKLCMVISVQDIHCPVFDLVRNVEFMGMYQTVTKKGAITVTRDYFKQATFFVVLVVKPNNIDCGGADALVPPTPLLPYREKHLKVVVSATVSETDFVIASLGSVTWFLMFYIIALIVSVLYHVRQRRHDGSIEEVPHPSVARRLARMAADGSTESEQDRLLNGRPSSPINPSDGQTYGTIEEPSGSGSFASGADLSNNGIPHRIPPPDETTSDTSDIDVSDIDMLPDINEEKDIFRTKTTLYVADLSRKSTKKLSKKYKLYFWNLIPIAIFYGLPVVQLVITYQTVVNVTGNEDICYYNFYCANPLGVLSAFNNVFSNIGYIMLGFLFLILVFRRDMYYRKMVKLNDRLEKHYGIPQHFGLFYAMGLSLMMEGVLSGCYHVCPSYTNYQFDTSFMYMTAWLLMLKIYQTRHPDVNAHSHTAYVSVAIVILLAVVGVVYDTVQFWVLFAIVYIIGILLISINVYYMGRWKMDVGMFKRAYQLIRTDRLHCAKPLYTDRMVLLIIGNIVNWTFAILGLVYRPKDFATYLLAILIVNLLMYCAFYIIMKLRSREKIMLLPTFYIVLASIIWGFAFYFFVAKLTSWELTPAQSREGNKSCILFNFFDHHDVWHFLSSMSLFLSFMVLLTLDDDLIPVPRDQIPVF